MKSLLALASLVFCTAAYSTGNHPPPDPKPDPHQTSVDVKNVDLDVRAGAKAGAVAGADATGGEARATGGDSKATGGSVGPISVDAAAGAGGSSSLTDSSSYRSNMYVLPAPMYGPPMAAVACPNAQARQRGMSIGWSFFSGYDHSTDTADCTLIQMRNAKVESCQYADAKQIEDQLTLKYLPNYKAVEDPRFINLSPSECSAVKAPPQVVQQTTNYIYEAAKACELQPPKKATAKAKRKPPACGTKKS